MTLNHEIFKLGKHNIIVIFIKYKDTVIQCLHVCYKNNTDFSFNFEIFNDGEDLKILKYLIDNNICTIDENSEVYFDKPLEYSSIKVKLTTEALIGVI